MLYVFLWYKVDSSKKWFAYLQSEDIRNICGIQILQTWICLWKAQMLLVNVFACSLPPYSFMEFNRRFHVFLKFCMNFQFVMRSKCSHLGKMEHDSFPQIRFRILNHSLRSHFVARKQIPVCPATLIWTQDLSGTWVKVFENYGRRCWAALQQDQLVFVMNRGIAVMSEWSLHRVTKSQCSSITRIAQWYCTWTFRVDQSNAFMLYLETGWLCKI